MTTRIFIAYTGGTIGMRRTENGYAPARGYLQEQMQAMPELWSPEMPEFVVEEFDPLLDSSNMTPDNWISVAEAIHRNYEHYDGFVVLHGTDTMAYTASALPFFLSGLRKPVIIAGSQIAMCEVRNDARQNLISALILAAYSDIPEVCLCFGASLLRGCRSVKVHSDGLDAFTSPNYPLRQGVKQILADALAQATFGEAQNAHELLELIAQERWDIVVLDLNMPDGSGLEALKQIKHDHPQLPVLILSMYPEDQYAVRTIRAGAAGYLNKESAPEELVQAIRKVLRGGEYISASVADELVLHARHEDDQPLHKHLSDREYQVLCMIAAGKEVKEISTELALSAKTISTYRTRLLEKMNMKTNAELTHYAIQNGLV